MYISRSNAAQRKLLQFSHSRHLSWRTCTYPYTRIKNAASFPFKIFSMIESCSELIAGVRPSLTLQPKHHICFFIFSEDQGIPCQYPSECVVQKWYTVETHPFLEARLITSDIPWNSTMCSSRILAWLCCAVLTLSDDKCSIPDVLGICSWSYCWLLFFCHLTFCHIWNVKTGQALLPAFWYG